MNILQFQALAPILYIIAILLNVKLSSAFISLILYLCLYSYINKYFSRLFLFIVLGLIKGSFDNFEQKPFSYKYVMFEANILDVQNRNNKQHLLLNNFKKIDDYETKLLIQSDERALFPNTALMELPINLNENFKTVKKIRCIGRFLLPIPNPNPYKYQLKIPKGKLKEVQIIEYKKETIKNYFRTKFYKYLDKKNADLCCAIFLADTFSIDTETRDEYNKAGTAHLLGVSMLNLAIILYILYLAFYFLLGKFFIKITNYITLHNISKIFSLSSILLYLYIIGTDYPLMRSFYMTMIATILLMFKKQNNIESLFYSAAIILSINPLAIYDLGFQLSFAGVLGIYAFDNIKFKNKGINLVWTTFTATTILGPISIYQFQNLSLQPYIGNLLIIPFLSLIIIPSILFYMFSPDFLCKNIAFLINFLFKILSSLVKYTTKTSMIIRFNPIKTKYIIICIILYIIFSIIKEKKRYIALFLSYFILILELYKAKCTFPFILVNNHAIALVLKDKIVAYPNNNFMTKQWSDLYKLPCENYKNSNYFDKKHGKIIILNKIAIVTKELEYIDLNDGLEHHIFTFGDLEKTQIIKII